MNCDFFLAKENSIMQGAMTKKGNEGNLIKKKELE